jgi:hypothetical protein
MISVPRRRQASSSSGLSRSSVRTNSERAFRQPAVPRDLVEVKNERLRMVLALCPWMPPG